MKKVKSYIWAIAVMLCLVSCSDADRNGSAEEGKEDQSCFTHSSTKNITSDENYYYTAVSGVIEASPKEHLDFQVICNKPECFHEDDSCIAWLGSGAVFASEGKLFALKSGRSDDMANYELVQISIQDGITTKISTIVQSVESEEGGTLTSPPEFMIHKGYAYYVLLSGADSGEAVSSVYRVKLVKNAKPEKLFEVSGEAGSGCKLRGKGNQVYILSLYLEKESVQSIKSDLYSYSVTDHTLNLVESVKGKEINNDFCIHDQELIYRIRENYEIHSVSLKNGEDRLLVPGKDTEMTGNMLNSDSYIFDWRNFRLPQKNSNTPYIVRVYTYGGELAVEIALPVQDEEMFSGYILGGDEKYLFFYQKEITEHFGVQHHVWTYDLTDLSDGEWKDHILNELSGQPAN